MTQCFLALRRFTYQRQKRGLTLPTEVLKTRFAADHSLKKISLQMVPINVFNAALLWAHSLSVLYSILN